MAKKLEVGVSEMLELREQGFSNREIAEMLDISYPTVHTYIGKQGYKSSHRPKPVPPAKEEEKIKLISQTVAVNGFLFQLSKFKEALNLVSGTFVGLE